MNQDDFNYKALEQLKIISSRLESIERMLGAESKTEQKEPEWLPMKEAPQHDQEWIEVIDVDGKITKAYWIDRSNDIFNTTGWFDGRGIVFDPKGWKPLNSESVTQEPEWRPMSTAPRDCKCIKVKHAKTGEEFFASFFYDGWSCSASRYKPDNTFLFFDVQLLGWHHL